MAGFGNLKKDMAYVSIKGLRSIEFGNKDMKICLEKVNALKKFLFIK